MRKPSFDMIEIPSGKNPAWQNECNRVTFEEDIRIHVFDAIDNIDSIWISEEERSLWEKTISSLGNLAEYYKKKGFIIHTH